MGELLPATLQAAIDPWHVLDRWSAAIHECIFGGEAAARPVYLDLEDDVIARIAARAGGTAEDPEGALAAAVKPTLNLEAGTPPLLQAHVGRTIAWRGAGAEGTPPFLAALAFMSLVAEGMRSDGEFRASNYYGRFCQALGQDPADRRLRTKISNGFGEHSLTLWGALNEWLEGHGGSLGLPTAFAFDSRTYVGLPLSQALVRDADRRILPEMFVAYRLRPGQVVSRTDMSRLLGDWIAGSRLSSGLKVLLERQDEVAGRIADVACVELQAWDGALPRDVEQIDPGMAGLLLTAQLRTQPLPRLYVDLGIERIGLPDGPYSLGDAASPHAIAAFDRLDGSVSLEEPDPRGWRSVRRGAEVSLADLLLADLTLSGPEAQLRRPARRLIVLEYDDESRRFTEVPRIQLGTRNLLLCHDSLATELEAILGEIARPGSRSMGPAELQGVPAGWIAVSPVEALAISDTEVVDLIGLVPLSWTQIALGGGFPLPGRLTWLTEAPPEVRASSAEGGSLVVTLHCERALGASIPEDRELGGFAGQGVVPIPATDPGDYRIILRDADHPRAAPLASALLRLRSPATPRPILSEDEPHLRHHLGEPLGPLSAAPAGAPPDVDGALILCARPEASIETAGSLPRSADVQGTASEAEEDDLPAPAGEIQGGPPPGCLLGRAHYFLLPYYGPGSPPAARVEGTCKECGLEKEWPSRPRRARRGVHAATAIHTAEGERRPRPGDLRPIVEDSPADWDRLLGALSYARRGPWSSFEAMALAVEDSPWFALEAARSLSSLGHLNLTLDPRTLRPIAWSMAPPTIARIGEDRAILCGSRSPELLDALASDIEILDGLLLLEPALEGPTVARIEGLGQGELDELIGASAELPLAPRLADCPAQALAQELPQLEGLLDALPRLERPPALPLERFDFAIARWAQADGIDGPGAYRFRDRPLRYCVAGSEPGALHIADNRLAKWLGAQQIGLSLMSYDSDSDTLICPLGAQLPGLYERAAVLASGALPVRRRDGTVTYEFVPAEVASALWARLGPGGTG
jgi:hypothetical protein